MPDRKYKDLNLGGKQLDEIQICLTVSNLSFTICFLPDDCIDKFLRAFPNVTTKLLLTTVFLGLNTTVWNYHRKNN